jgi:putative flippase GtrA
MRLLGLSFVRFGLVGLSNTAVGFMVIYLCLRVLSFGDFAANATGYVAGFLWSFALNRVWTFRHRGPRVRSMARFAVVCVVAYVANVIALMIVRRYFEPASLIPQIVAICVYTIVGYAGSRWFAFPRHESASGDATY